jgi:hypothetical protein
MAGSINEFKASFRKDLARPNKFDVNIPVPLTLIPYVNNAKRLNYRCENASLPGRNFATSELKIGSNPVEKYPYLTTFNDLDLTFIVDDDMNQKVFFDAWLSYISANYYSAIPGIGGESFGRLAFDFEYKDNYATNITVTQKTLDGRDAYKSILKEAFPISVNAMPLSWEAQNTINKLSVTFAFRYFTDNMFKNITLQAPFI